ncbi:MAG: HIT domain-containing protein [Nanoarchaeota archaeon]|nr:HIT domain-containing protein [Nanoarchaeota archaeon]MBU1322200.1 HIT domain-containing protein [Nanoarchaeota archaeon]MBU1597741.1 HIT domain-containing protein [Nanoarchaeota archaeon]MBU2442005.1 HIT domain-containing protein [Nanoarchaeota archaeon]
MVSEEDLQSMSPEEIAELQRKNCIFCKIIGGEIPSKKVFEDDKLIGILDINPAAKGHTLMMTKEHYPILPVIPLDVAAHMFRTTKQVVKALKDAIVTNKSTVFIANGAIAGQQSPHFLYHIIPRENDDGLDNFNIPANEFREEEITQHLASLKGKLGLMMREYKSKKGTSDHRAVTSKPMKHTDLAQYIEQNPDIKEKILKDPEGFKKEVETNPDLKKLFESININKLSSALGAIGRK